jgi:hypothetical protein
MPGRLWRGGSCDSVNFSVRLPATQASRFAMTWHLSFRA